MKRKVAVIAEIGCVQGIFAEYVRVHKPGGNRIETVFCSGQELRRRRCREVCDESVIFNGRLGNTRHGVSNAPLCGSELV